MKWKNKTKGGIDVTIYATDMGWDKQIHGYLSGIKEYGEMKGHQWVSVESWTRDGCLIEDPDEKQWNDDGRYDLVPVEVVE